LPALRADSPGMGVVVRQDDGRLQSGTAAPETSLTARECAMAIRQLRVYTGPEIEHGVVSLVPPAAATDRVRVSLGEVLPLLADAVASNRTWVSDFADDELEISADLHDVLQAYRHFRRPGA